MKDAHANQWNKLFKSFKCRHHPQNNWFISISKSWPYFSTYRHTSFRCTWLYWDVLLFFVVCFALFFYKLTLHQQQEYDLLCCDTSFIMVLNSNSQYLWGMPVSLISISFHPYYYYYIDSIFQAFVISYLHHYNVQFILNPLTVVLSNIMLPCL